MSIDAWLGALRDAEPSIVISLAAAAALYAAGVRAVWHRAGRGHGVSVHQAASFAAGIAALAIALLSPLDTMAEQLFAAHMVQHMVLIAIAPPLLVLGAPVVAFSWGVPRRLRMRVHRWWHRADAARAAASGIGAALLSPWVVWLPHAVAIWAWHTPALYQRALENGTLHALEHLSFIGTALPLWWAVLEPRGVRREGYAAGILVLLATAMHSGALGALLVFARTPWYPVQAAGAASWGLTALEDQQLAGLIMWIPGGFIYLAASSWLFLGWIGTGERRRVVRPAPALRVMSLLAIALASGIMAGCRRPATVAIPGGDPGRGKKELAGFGCGSCHTIDGVTGAHGKVGPPLTGIGERSMIAGEAANTPENLVRWIENPQSIEPNTAMPNLGVGDQAARDMAAYLYTLR
jgi:cytochrome c oxidase assembly factor CtaG/cytochrome c2